MSTGTCRWLFLLLFLIIWTKSSNSKEIRVVCYYTNWSVYRPGTAKFSPQNINPYLCTHLIYAFGGFTKENTLKPFDKYQDIEKGGYAKFTGLKTYNKNLKTMLAIGGWNEGSSRFSPMVANPERRKELIRNAIKFLRQNHFDGLDLDWEYPSFRDGGKSRDRDNYAQLVQELREEFERESEKTGRPRLLLTMAVPAGIEYINKGYDVPKLTKYLDWMNILSYDYHSAFEPAVNHHAPLYPLEEPSEYNYDTELNIDYTIEHYLKKGADPNKLVLGIPTYGRSYTLFNPDANEIGAPADGPGDMGEATRENGYLAYYEICENIKSQDWEVVQSNPDAMGPYAFKENQWVGYDDDDIARKKAAYVAEKNLGGIMFWSIDNDDFRGTCHGKPYPIIEAAKEALISAYGLTEENLVSPPAKPTKSKTRTRTQSSSKSSSNKNEDDKKTSNSGGSRRRNRVKNKSESSSTNIRAKTRRKETRSTTEGTIYSSLELVTPSYTTPAPPPTPGMGGEFKCEDEGFYPHPKDCKKYFWCLSGPGELGIVAHQFTCPAGLYFNKAADSCDYTRNVLCNKKLSKGTTTTTEATTTTKTSATSTVRVPPKITAATSRTTVFRTSTTTEPYEDEYEEYEDEEDSKNSEEDPRVIKELLDLIRKAGGIEELEKQLKLQEDGSASISHPDVTTPSSISKSLVERVLGKAAKGKDTRKTNSYSFLNRNSRGPQNDGLRSSEEKEKHERGRPQYTTIARQRSPKTEEKDDDDEEEDEKAQRSSKKQPEYVNIRRGRISTTTEDPDENSKTQINRNKILGEDDNDDDEEEQSIKKKAVSPQYVNIRRQRPSTTEESSTSKYNVIRRGTTTEPEDVESSSTEKIDAKSKYKILRRGTTTEASTVEADSILSKRRGTTTTRSGNEDKYITLKRGTTTVSSSNTEETASEDSTARSATRTTQEEDKNTTVNSKSENPITVEQILISSPDSLTLKTTASISTTNRPLEHSKTDSILSSNGSGEGVYQTQTPQLLEPRPFSLSTSGPTSSLKPVTETSTRVTKVSDPNYKLRLKQKLPSTQTEVVSTTILTTEKPTPFRSRAPSRYKQSTPSQVDHETSRPIIKPSVRARKRFSTTTEKLSQEEYDIERTYRPSEIADLSSLTAVDFTAFKEINGFNNPSRQRRPRPSSATTTTQKPEGSLKTGSRTLPLARKLLDGTTFGKSRRVLPSKNEPSVEDQINSSSDTTHRVRSFTRTSNFTTTTERSTRATLRNRKVIRRLRPTVTSKLRNSDDHNNQLVLKKLGQSNSTPGTDTENLIENASSNSLHNRRFSRPVSTVAKEVNKLASTTESLERASKNSKRNDEEHNETSDDVSGEEGENIRLSESNIRENSNVNNLNDDDEKKIRKKVLKRIRNKVEDDKTSTEPNIIVRTRKIVRKLQPTDSSLLSITSTTESIEANTQNRKRKIIRRLRPTGIPSLSTAEPPTEKTLYVRGRPFLAQFTTESNVPAEDTELPVDKSTAFKYKTITRTTPSSARDDENDDLKEPTSKTKATSDESLPRAIDRSKYNTINRGTTSTTSNYDTEEREFEKEEVSPKGRTKYRIYRPTIFHEDDEDDEDDEDEEDEEDEEPLNIRILTPNTEIEATDGNLEIHELNKDDDSDEKELANLTTEESSTDKNDESKEDEEETTTTTTTVRNYVNPILSRQKSRPAFVRPKLTTESPLPSSTATRSRYRTVSRGRTPRPSQLQTSTEAVDGIKTERKFVPKNYNRSRHVSTGRENRTEESVSQNSTTAEENYESTESVEIATLGINTTEETHDVSSGIETTEEIFTTVPYNGTSNEFDDAMNETSVFTTSDNNTVPPETSTVKVIDLTTSKAIEIETTVISINNTTETPEVEAQSIETTVNYSEINIDNTTLSDLSKSGESEANTTVDHISTSADTTSETTPVYSPKSTLRSILARPKYTVPKRLTSTESSTAATRAAHKFNQRNQGQNVKPKVPSLRSTTAKNRFLYRYSTTEKQVTEEEEYNDEEENIEVEEEKPRTTPKTKSKSKPRISNKPEGFSFRKTTEVPKVTENLGDIDTEAVRSRNKNLFAKKRKMNTPLSAQAQPDDKVSTEDTNVANSATLTTTPVIPESVTKPTQDFETTTEHLTTLHHIFAETEMISGKEKTTIDPSVPLNPTNTKLERLIEVNRIVEVHDKNNTVIRKDNKVIDKVGVINRVTVVKIVDPEENEIASEKSESTTESSKDVDTADSFEIATVREIPNVDPRSGFTDDRQQRKYEVYGASKINDYSSGKGAEIIDGRSNINIITPRPYYSTEASTISLEALFQTDTPQKLNNLNVDTLKTSSDDELLETGNSHYVNVRILGQEKEESQLVSVRVPKEEDYITMKAEVVEVTPKISKEFIKIVPIQVEMSRKLILNSDFDKKIENGVPKVNFQILKSVNK